MKPFDLDAAKRGEPIQTRDGRLVKFIAHVPEAFATDYKVLALLDGETHEYTEEGAFISKQMQRDRDLFMAPKKRTVWVNLYPDSDNRNAAFHPSQSNADMFTGLNSTRIGGKAWPLEIEE